MKPQIETLEAPQVVDLQERRTTVLHEQQALHRLKRLEEIARERRKRAWALRILLTPVWKALVWLFTPAIPVRRDAPHLPPIPQSEWDRGERFIQKMF